MPTKRLSFSGHETFAFRYGWLSKGVSLAASNPTGFFGEEATTTLGVGKNMVSSIRHWCEALGLIAIDGRLKRGMVRSLGTKLFGEEGYDPYLEHHSTLWLLQWQLCRAPSPATTWHYAFTRWNKAVFSRDELVTWLLRVAVDSGDAKVSRASLKRDVDVFLRTYVAADPDPRRAPEDSFDCPLTELGLIREVESGTFEFRRSAHTSLPVPVLAMAILDFWASSAPEQRTLTFERVMYGPGSPGAVFQLTESALARLLGELPRRSGVSLDESAGMRRLVKGSTTPKGLDLLSACYEEAAA